MSEAVFDDKEPFLGQPLRAAAVLCRTEQGNLHTGLLYKNGESACVLHLGWQDRLSKEWTWPRLWAAPDVEPERLLSVAGYCRLIWNRYEQDRKFPYAIQFSGTTFDIQGQLVFGENSRGLTCASFVLAIFLSMGITLVDESDWPVRPEEGRKFLKAAEEIASPDHSALLRAEVEAGCVGILPDEVLGACGCPLPAKYEPTRAAADRVLKKLDS